jgi:hypothetical protein
VRHCLNFKTACPVVGQNRTPFAKGPKDGQPQMSRLFGCGEPRLVTEEASEHTAI